VRAANLPIGHDLIEVPILASTSCCDLGDAADMPPSLLLAIRREGQERSENLVFLFLFYFSLSRDRFAVRYVLPLLQTVVDTTSDKFFLSFCLSVFLSSLAWPKNL